LARTSYSLETKGCPSNKHGNIFILIQLHISQSSMDSFSLISNVAYISASLAQITWPLFDICLRRGWCEISLFILKYGKVVDCKVWSHQYPLRKFDKDLYPEIWKNLEKMWVWPRSPIWDRGKIHRDINSICTKRKVGQTKGIFHHFSYQQLRVQFP